MIRVALVMERIETWRGGAETSTMQFARHLADLGCDVTILTNSDAQSMPGLTVVPVHSSSSLRALRTQQFAREVDAYVAEHPFDIVHAITPCLCADVYQPRGGTLPETLERNLAIRSVSAARRLKRFGQGINLKYRAMLKLERALMERDPRPYVIALSDYVARQLEKHYRLSGDRVRLIYNGVDPDVSTAEERRGHRIEIRRQFKLADNDTIALCVAHNFKLKGVGKLIEAARQVIGATRASAAGAEAASPSESDVHLLIVGRDDPTAYARQAHRLGIGDRVIFAGPTQRIGAFFHAADFLVHPTYYDPFSRVVLEAMSAGLPAITTRWNGAAEQITDGQNGFVVDSPDDVDGLARAMQALCDPQRRATMGPRARESVAALTMARHAEQVIALYREILEQRAQVDSAAAAQANTGETPVPHGKDAGRTSVPRATES